MADSLANTARKRDFGKTARAAAGAQRRKAGQAASLPDPEARRDARLHYDFRLELDGVLMSWAVPKGPSLDPKDKRLAVHARTTRSNTATSRAPSPKGEYGGGTVMLWDRGTWEPIGDPEEALAKGDLNFSLHGERLKGEWRARPHAKPRKRNEANENWLLIKERDEYAARGNEPTVETDDTASRSGRTMDEIAAGNACGSSQPGIKKADPPKAAKARAGSRAPAKGSRARSQPSSSRSSRPSSTRRRPAMIGSTRSSMTATACIAASAGGEVRFYTRSGLDWTDIFRRSCRALPELPFRQALIDGEVAVADKDGRTDFGALQDRDRDGEGRGSATTCSTCCRSTARTCARSR